MALMPRSKHKATKGKGNRPHPKSSKRTHSSGDLKARGGGVRAKAARKVERRGGPAAMQTDDGSVAVASARSKQGTGFKVGAKGKLKKGSHIFSLHACRGRAVM